MITVTRPLSPDPVVFSGFVDRIFETACFSNAGPLVQELEAKLKAITGSAHLHFVSNGTIAIELALQAAGVKGEVITTPFTFCASSNSIDRAGATPVFVDILPDDLTINPSAIEQMIGPNTEAILGVHVYGQHCRMDAIQRIADKHGLFVLHDAAHAFNTRYFGEPISAFGDATTYRFRATKLLHMGEGGAIETRHGNLSRRIELKRNFSLAGEGNRLDCGTNVKVPEMSAAVGIALLDLYKVERERRSALAQRYTRELSGVPGLHLEPHFSASGFHYIVRVLNGAKKRDALQAHLSNHGILARRSFWPLTSSMPLSRKIVCPSGTPVAQKATESVLALPFHGAISEQDVGRICGQIQDFMRSAP